MKQLLTSIICLFLFSVTTFSQSNNINQDNETLQSKKGYFVFLMDSINTALQALRDDASSETEKFIYYTLNPVAQYRMAGKILDEFTKVEISDWTNYETEDCGWPNGTIDKDWKAIEFSTRESLTSEWNMCYRRIVFRIEVCGGRRHLAVYKRNHEGPIIETFNDLFFKSIFYDQETFYDQDEVIKYLLKEMRRSIPYPVEKGYSLAGNFYAERRNEIMKQLGYISYFPYDPTDKLCGVWFTKKKIKYFLLGPPTRTV